MSNQVEGQSVSPNDAKPVVMRRFFFTKFHQGTEYAGWQMGWLGYAVGIRKWPRTTGFAIWKTRNSREVVWLNRGFQFIWPLPKNNA